MAASADIHQIPDHIGVNPEAPRITPARGPWLLDDCGSQESGVGVDAEPDREFANQFGIMRRQFLGIQTAASGENRFLRTV